MRDAGMSTRVCLAVTALRIRVSMSAIGSVMSQTFESGNWMIWSSGNGRRAAPSPITLLPDYSITPLPTALRHACHVTLERQLPEAEAAERELPHVGARPTAQVAAVAQANLVFRFLLFLGD